MTKRERLPHRSRWNPLSPPVLGVLVRGSFLAFMLLSLATADLVAQDYIQTESERVITVSRGSTAILTRPDSITRVSVADPDIAVVVIIPPNQVLINALQPGSTSVIVWGSSGVARLYTVEVTADVASLQRQMDELFPGAGLTITSTGTSVVLSGEVRDPAVVRKALELANAQGIPVVNNVDVPAPEQILLHVEFAEVSRSVVRELGGDLIRVLNPTDIDQVVDDDATQVIETLSEGFVTVALSGQNSALDAVVRALKSSGEFRSLAQPNLVTREGQEATFLAGGEFPFPVIQGGGGAGGAGVAVGVTIQWKEYGVRLSFTPTITNVGNIQLRVAPEVSSLDFANGLTFEGFNIPSLKTRRVDTDVELQSGQTLAIGGLMDSEMFSDIDKIPLLGDIPILGFLFRSESMRQDRSELVVLVTPYILDSNNLPAPPVVTGDPVEWEWDPHIMNWIRARADTLMGGRSGSGGG